MASTIIPTFPLGGNCSAKIVVACIALFHLAKYFISTTVSGEMPSSMTTKTVHSHKALSLLPQQFRDRVLQDLTRFKCGRTSALLEGHFIISFLPH